MIATIIIIALLIIWGIFAIRRVVRDYKSGRLFGGCSGNCSACDKCSHHKNVPGTTKEV